MGVKLREIIRSLALQIEPASTPVLDRGQEFHVEIDDIFTYLDSECTGVHRHSLSLTRDRKLFVELHWKDSFPQGPVRMNAQEAFTKDYEARDMLDSIWGKVKELNPVNVDQRQEKRMQGKRKTTGKMVGKDDPFQTLGAWKLFILGRLAETTWSLRDLTFFLQRDEGLHCNIGALPVSCSSPCCRSTGGCGSACSGSFPPPSSHGCLQGSTEAEGRR